MSAPFVFPAPACPSVAIARHADRFPVRRIFCVARNYEDHAKEMGGAGREPPFFFMKPADAVVADAGQGIEVPYASLTRNLHHEVELVVALGRGGRDVPKDRALDLVWGYAVGLDMTRRDLQSEMKQQGRPWDIAKGFDASAPIGSITPAEQVPAIADAAIELRVNGRLAQASRIRSMIWSVAEVIAELSRGWHLQAGDLIFTGTPAGVGPVTIGDELQGHIDGLTDLRARIVAAAV